MSFYIYLLISFVVAGCATSIPSKNTSQISTVSCPPIKGIKYSSSRFIWPLKGKVISKFGDSRNHNINKGIDIKSSFKKKVRASSSGKVVFCGTVRGYGLTIIIEHPQGYYTLYSNNFQSLVKTYEYVRKGQVIALLGMDSWNKEPILHFEIRKKQKPLNPLTLLN